MKKWFLVVGVVIIILAIAAYNSKFYYPELPIQSVSKKEVLQSLNDSSNDIVKIAEENDYEWYIKHKNRGIVTEDIKAMISEQGWEFKTQEGSGYIFEKENQTLIATTKMWTRNYVIIQIPKNWNE